MSAIKGLMLGCVSDRSNQLQAKKSQQDNKSSYEKVKFGVPLSEALRDDNLPRSLVDLLVYIAQEGVATTDLFRRAGNPSDARVIMKKLSQGQEVILPNYNFYTLASVIKKFLLKLPHGLFGEEGERRFLKVLQMEQRIDQYDTLHEIITSLPQAAQQLMSLLFGTWFRIVNHSEFNTMSSEAVAKSVAGSLFHTCADDPDKINSAVQVLQILIDDFGVANMFGRANIQYFADRTRTDISVKEKYQYAYSIGNGHGSAPSITEEQFYGHRNSRAHMKNSANDLRVNERIPASPQSLQPTYSNPVTAQRKLTGASSMSAPEVNKIGLSETAPPELETEQGRSPMEAMANSKLFYQSQSLSRYDNVRRRQLMRMRKRSNWFLQSGGSGGGPEASERSELLSTSLRSYGGGSSTDVLMTDATSLTSDGGLSPCSPNHAQIRQRLSSDGSFISRSDMPLYESTPRRVGDSTGHLQQPDFVNGNHTLPVRGHNTPQRRRSTPTPPVTEQEVRCFMKETNFNNVEAHRS